MNDFDKAYNEILEAIEEGRFKSAVAGGLIGLGALGGGQQAQAATPATDAKAPAIQQTVDKQQHSRKKYIAKLRELKILAQQAIADNNESGYTAIEAEVSKIMKILKG